MTDENVVRLQTKLNLETAQIAWKDLQTFFANGSVVFVDPQEDLLLVAEQLAADNTEMFRKWMNAGLVGKVTDAQAALWYEQEAVLWSVVVKPWVLVQARDES